MRAPAVREILGAALLVACALAATRLPPRGEEPATRAWTFVYVMGYDNDLDGWGRKILARIEDGVRTTGGAASVLADFRRPGGLLRIVLTGAGREEERLGSEASTSLAVLEDHLCWTARHLPARRYGVVFLDHGGGLDEMVLDEHPGPGESDWLSAREVGPAVARFRRAVPGEVEIVFLQQCGRGTVENLYNFRGAARAVMASQTWVGVPNSYYAALFRWLDEHPEATGAQVAETIAYEDHDFTNYVAVDGDRLTGLPAALAPAIAALTAGGTRPAKRPEAVPTCYVCRIRTDEKIHDLLAFTEAAAVANGLDPAAPVFSDLRRFVTENLIVLHRKNPAKAPEIPDWTGLGILVPPTKDVADRHRDYPLYREVPGLPLVPR